MSSTNNTWKAGAENHNEGRDFARIRAARQAYDEWMPIRGHRDGNQGPIYRSFEIGNLADLMMLTLASTVETRASNMLKMFHLDRNGMTHLTRRTSGELVLAQLQIYPQALLRF